VGTCANDEKGGILITASQCSQKLTDQDGESGKADEEEQFSAYCSGTSAKRSTMLIREPMVQVTHFYLREAPGDNDACRRAYAEVPLIGLLRSKEHLLYNDRIPPLTASAAECKAAQAAFAV
jgi:hypothetical protein